ncbi:MFS transporter [Lentibacillus sp.]|uniref:MFS transporter n=1 Tax=Lentibacillus sp. TaxID=1925746 RepID=UPI002B4ABD4D|nr:MFS transporter [Lentibacillus sp.]
MSSFVVVLDFASIFIPLPTIMEDLDGTLDEATWVITAFILAFAVFLLPSSKFANNHGRRRLFLYGVTVFTTASIACAIAPSMGFLIGARVVLGIGAAMVEAAVFALIKAAIPNEKQSLAFKVQGIAFILGALLGTPLSGAITTSLSWEYIFWLNVLVGVAVVLVAPLVIPKSGSLQGSGKSDILGLVLSGAGLFLLFFAIIEGERIGWSSQLILGSFVGAAALLALFIVSEIRAEEPLADLSLFKDRFFAVGNLLRWASEFASMGIYFAISHYLQVELGHSAFVTGLLLMSVIIGGMFVSPITEPLSKRVDGRWLVIPGFLLVAGGTFWLAHVSTESGWAFFLAPLAIAGAGFVAQEGPTMGIRDRNVSPEQFDDAWCISYTIFLLGVGLGVAVVSAVWQSQFASNMKEFLSGADLPAGVADKISVILFDGGISGDPASEISGPDTVQQLIQLTFADAVNTALLSCVLIAFLGAVIGLFLTSNRKNDIDELNEERRNS